MVAHGIGDPGGGGLRKGGIAGALLVMLAIVVLLDGNILRATATPTTGYLYLNHTTGQYSFSTSRAHGEYFIGEGCGSSDQPGDADLAWQVGGCSGPVASALWKPDILTTGWDELTITTSARFDDRTQAYAAGWIEGWLTHERIYSLTQTLIRKRSVDPNFIEFLTKQDRYLRAQIQEYAPVVFEHENEKLQGKVEPQQSEEQSFWYNVALTIRQLDGMLAGYNARADGAHQITLLELWQLNDDGDKMDIIRAVQAEQKSKAQQAASLSVGSKIATLGAQARFAQKGRFVSDMSKEEVLELVAFNGHCSALVRFTGDDLIVGHNTWSDYDLFLRIAKHFDFGYHHSSIHSQSVSFTSYPGFLSSSDDFYVTSKGSSLVLTETTITILDESLYTKHVGPEKGVLAWIRNQIANRRARTGKEWTELFQQRNSGTYNDAWLIVDMSKFEEAKLAHGTSPAPKRRSASDASEKSKLPAGAGVLSPLTSLEALSPPTSPEVTPISPPPMYGGIKLLTGTFYLLEQIPGTVEVRELTPILQEVGYFAGYNLPFTRTIAEKSMYVSYAEEFDTPSLEYSTASRAKIFAQEAPKVLDVEGMKTLLRLNDFQLGEKSLTQGCPAAAVSARYDLPHLPSAKKCEITQTRLNGAIDGKVVNSGMVKSRRMELISGPTSSGGLPPFDWNSPSITKSDRRKYHSAGSPMRFDFSWIQVTPGQITPLPKQQPAGTEPKKVRSSCVRRRKRPVLQRPKVVEADVVTPSSSKRIKSPQDRQRALKAKLGKNAKKKMVKHEVVIRKQNLTKAILKRGKEKKHSKKQKKKVSKAVKLAMQLLEQQGE